MNTRSWCIALALSGLLGNTASASPEICGNGVDDDADGTLDEGCYPTLTTGICESPLSCSRAGMVGWTSGSLHYDIPPDVSTQVPYGPAIAFKRFYTPMYSPGGAGPASVNHTPLGPGWQHNYMSWLDDAAGGTNPIVLHTSQGRDVYCRFSSSAGITNYYTPQATDNLAEVSRVGSGPDAVYYVKLLTGETLKYNAYGQIIEVWDTLPTPNKVLITWTGTVAANVATVTDASGRHRLSFSYANNLLTSLQLQHQTAAGGWVTDHTTAYDYSNYVSRDGTSGWFVPASSTDWSNLLQGSGIPNPTNLWLVQETTGNLADSIGGSSLTAHNNGGMSYAQTISGWSRKAVKLAALSTSYWQSVSSICNPATTKCTTFGLITLNGLGTINTNADVFALGDTNGAIAAITSDNHTGNASNLAESWKASYSTTLTAQGNIVRPWILSSDPTSNTTSLTTDNASVAPSWSSGSSATGKVTLGSLLSDSAAASFLYAATWNGTALSASQRAKLISLIKNGPGILTKVTFEGQLAQQYTYTNAYLTRIGDSNNNEVASFAYSSSGNGAVNIINTDEGSLGFEYSSSRSSCLGKTLVYFNKANATNCSVDSDCGSGNICGAKTGAGSTGSCFQAARCLTTSTVQNETVVTDVTPVGAGGACTGSCAKLVKYVWSAGAFVQPTALQDATTSYTSIAYCATTGSGCTAGKPYQIGYGDNDTDPTNGGWNRTVYIYYDSMFPGRVAEVRRPSELSPSASSCSYTNFAGCDRTLYLYGAQAPGCSNDNQLCIVRHGGWTVDPSGNPSAYPTWVDVVTKHDSFGRLAEVDGPGPNVKQVLDYYSATDPYPYYMKDVRSFYGPGASDFLQLDLLDYDVELNIPTALRDPDGSLTCNTYSNAFGFLMSTRHTMVGQSTCATSNPADLTTSFVRVGYHFGPFEYRGLPVQITRPDGSCVFSGYDNRGRLIWIKRRDDCSTSSAGDLETLQYNTDGKIAEVDLYDQFGGVSARQAFGYYNGGQVQQLINPVDPTKYAVLQYDAAGRLIEVDGEGSLSKTVFHRDGAAGRDSRVTSVDRYKTNSTYDTWSFLYSWFGYQKTVTDGDSKTMATVFDDFGNLAKFTSPDLAYPTVRVFDTAGNVTSVIEALGGGAYQRTHTFTYDALGRELTEDYSPRCPTGSTHVTTSSAYDTLPVGVNCPSDMSAACTNTQGRLAYISTVLLCDEQYADGSLDQQSFYAYDKAGRLIEEYTTDDTGRITHQYYAYTPNGDLKQMTTASGAVLGWTYGSTANNSDADRVASSWRGSEATPVTENVVWYPFGPLERYDQENTVGSARIQTQISRNLAYRPTDVDQKAGTVLLFDAAVGEDAMGRTTSRVYTNGASGIQSSYFLYDQQSRLTCETSNVQTTCPASGSTLKNGHTLSPPFTNAGDWKRLQRPIAGSSGGFTNDINASGSTYGPTHQITDVNQSDGSPIFGHTAFAYDVRGNRISDDNTTTLGHDGRTYSYDGRGNLVGVRGEYYVGGGAWHFYDVTSGFDAFDRRVYKSFYDESTGTTATWFFYYDVRNRLSEVRFTPNATQPGTYSVFQLFWLEDLLIAFWQTDFPGSITSKRYVSMGANNRPIDMWSWPSSGDATRVWAVNPSAWGFDQTIVGASVYQPILFPGQYLDSETAAYEDDGLTVHRPGLALNGLRTYDPFVGAYLQPDPLADRTLSSYVYANNNPVDNIDPTGLATITCHREMYCDDYDFASEKCNGTWEVSGFCYYQSDGVHNGLPLGGANPGAVGNRRVVSSGRDKKKKFQCSMLSLTGINADPSCEEQEDGCWFSGVPGSVTSTSQNCDLVMNFCRESERQHLGAANNSGGILTDTGHTFTDCVSQQTVPSGGCHCGEFASCSFVCNHYQVTLNPKP